MTDTAIAAAATANTVAVCFSRLFITETAYSSRLYEAVKQKYPVFTEDAETTRLEGAHDEFVQYDGVDTNWVYKALFIVSNMDNLPADWALNALHVQERALLVLYDFSVTLWAPKLENFQDCARFGRYESDFKQAELVKGSRGLSIYI